jgi:hypothetical protein
MKKKFLTTQWIALLCAFALPVLFGACDNPANDDDKQNIVPGNNEETYDTGEEDDDEDETTTPQRPVINAETSFSLVGAVGGEIGAVFTFPQTEDGAAHWQVEFADNGAGGWSNNYFDIVYYDEDIVLGENVVDGTQETIKVYYAKLIIKEGESLPIGIYSVQVLITGPGDYHKHKILVFKVVTAPQEFVIAPEVASRIIGTNKNNLEISWRRRPGAAGYYVYIATENIPPATPATTINGGDILSYTYSGTNGLPNSTNYFVWVKAYNASGETKFSPVKKRKTSDPIEAFFYTGKVADFNTYYPEKAAEASAGLSWDSGLDWYNIIPETDGSGVNLNYYGGYGTDQNTKIIYHARFDVDEASNATVQSGSGHTEGHTLWERYYDGPLVITDGTINGDTRAASGVFIYEYSSVQYPNAHYYATYYWGLGARQHTHSFGLNETKTHNLLIYFSNGAAGYADRTGPTDGSIAMYSPSLAHAEDNYTAAYMRYHIAWVAEPFFRRDINARSNNTSGWLPKPEDE